MPPSLPGSLYVPSFVEMSAASSHILSRASAAQRLRRAIGLMGWLSMIAGMAVDAATFTAGPDDYARRLRALRPGDTLELAPGEYRHGLRLHGLAGEPGQPIIVRGRSPDRRPVFVARPGHNTVSIIDSRHVAVRDLVIDGRGVPVDGIKAEGTSRYADFITLEHLRIVGHGADQSVVGISTQCPAIGWVIRHNEIIGAGTGIYLGRSDGSAAFVAGVIEGNRIVDTIGYNLQIKHQLSRTAVDGTLPQVTTIAGNVFTKSRQASLGREARPNVLLGHFPMSGAGSRDWYVVRGNLFFANPSERLLQAEGRVRVSNNVFVNHAGSAVALMPHKGRLVEAIVDNNTVVARDEGIRLVGATASTAAFANLVFAAQPFPGTADTGNATFPFERATDMLRDPLHQPPALDATVRPDAVPLVAAAPGTELPATTAASIGWQLTGAASGVDFAGTARTGHLPGALDLAPPAPVPSPYGVRRFDVR